jgi:hypothetical protein
VLRRAAARAGLFLQPASRWAGPTGPAHVLSRLQRYAGNHALPAAFRAPAGDRFKSSTSATAGGLGGLNLDVTFTVTGTPAASLQAIQTVMTTRNGPQVGSYSWVLKGQTWDAFVDGGKESPYVKISGNPPAHATEPYYLTAAEVAAQVAFTTDHGTIQVTDVPTAVAVHDEAYFETAIMAVNHDATGKDKVLKVFKWGWTGKGTKQQFAKGSKIAGADSGVLVQNSVSPAFKNIVKHDYPTYTFD